MKKPISATIDSNLINWLSELSKHSSQYRNKSHIIEIALEEFRSKLEEQEKAVTKKR